MTDLLMGSDEFESYVLSFYSKDNGIYPFDCSDDTIISAVFFVVAAGMNNETFAADSTDREKVRAVLEAVGYRELAKAEAMSR